MDKLKNLMNRLKYRMMNAALKKSLTIYIFIALITAFLCSMVIILFFENWRNIVYQVHVTELSIDELKYGNSYITMNGLLPEEVQKPILVINLLEMLSVIGCVVIAVTCVSHQYYKRKLEEPIKILQTEMQYLGRDDLSFECSYISGDEMGEICRGFNQMRVQLSENKKNLWDIMESQKELNASFAHDVRTPLTVMKGYIQMLLKYYPEGKVSQEKILETLQMLGRQVDRMEQFSSTMKEVHTIEEWKICHKKQNLWNLLQKINRNVEGMSGGEILIILHGFQLEKEEIVCDENLIQEVVDNLVSNALRFTKSVIQITVKTEDSKLFIYVQDDGDGFTKEALEKAARPYFSTTQEHFGLGLTISRTLCKKHGGNLEIMNSIDGGAITCAYFYVK